MLHVFGHTVKLPGIHEKRELVGRIERVFAELLCQFGLPLLNPGEALTRLPTQFGTTQYEVAHGVVVRLLLFAVERRDIHGLVFGVQMFVRAQAGPELGHHGQRGVVGGAQFR